MREQKQSNIRLRYNILTVFTYVIGIILLIQLFNLQIIHGAEYRQTSNTRLTRESELKAARGNIKDSSGIDLAQTGTAYTLEMYKTKIDNNTLNNTILKMVKVLEENEDKYIDEFPININPFSFSMEDVEKQKSWKKTYKINEEASAEEAFYAFKNKYSIENDNVEEIRKIIAIRYQISKEGYSSTKSIQISSNISAKSRDIFNEQNDQYPGISISVQPIRAYPKGNLASHILGYTSKIGQEELKEETEKGNSYTRNDYYGKAGIERVAEKYLKGQDGIKQIDMAVDGTITDEYIQEQAIQGADIILTIDARLQDVTQTALKNNVEGIRNGEYGANNQSDATGGAMVVMNVQTGEVLAMASYPDYEPSKFIFGIDAQTWKEYSEETKAIRNKAVSETYSPGSIFKMITAIAGLETGTITTTTRINDTGVYPYWDHPACWIWNSYHRGHGPLTVSGAIQHSCNYFFYDIGYRMGIDNLIKYEKYFGLGSKTGIELPAESVGQIAGPETSKKLNTQWYAGNTLSAVIGQENNKFTPIQMAKYASMIANGGKNINPTIIKAIQNADGTQVPKEEYEAYFNETLGITNEIEDLPINPENLEAVREGMKSVTSESGGTAYSIFKNFNIEVGGKTGSAQTGTVDENGKKITHAWFLGFAPFDNPEIAVVIVVENGAHGSTTAYAAKDVMEQYFGMNDEKIDEGTTAEPYAQVQN